MRRISDVLNEVDRGNFIPLFWDWVKEDLIQEFEVHLEWKNINSLHTKNSLYSPRFCFVPRQSEKETIAVLMPNWSDFLEFHKKILVPLTRVAESLKEVEFSNDFNTKYRQLNRFEVFENDWEQSSHHTEINRHNSFEYIQKLWKTSITLNNMNKEYDAPSRIYTDKQNPLSWGVCYTKPFLRIWFDHFSF